MTSTTTARTTSQWTRVTFRGRTPRKGESIYDFIDRTEQALAAAGHTSRTATVAGVVNSPRTFAVEADVLLEVDGFDTPAVNAAAAALIDRLPADLRFRLHAWAPR